MPRHVASLISGSTLLLSLASFAFAQVRSGPVLVRQQASVRNGSVLGFVRDDDGRAVSGASIVALGAMPLPAMARSDTAGRFTLALPPGDYILRATRQGYVSTYREAVRIQSSSLLERNIVLTRQGIAARAVLTASSGLPFPDELPREPPLVQDEATGDAHSEAAWRLRHLTPTALRDIAMSDGLDGAATARPFKPRSSIVDWMMEESTRAAASFFSNTDFSGQVNFLTTSSLAPANGWMPAAVPRGIAYVAVGAPVGAFGDWTVRGAVTAGSLSSWVVLGEYASRDDQAHAFNVGVSYSSQLSSNGGGAAIAAVNDQVRSVGGMYGFDHWRAWRALELDYGVRLDRYDYVAGSAFLSPRFGARLALVPATHISVLASERAIAPGGDEFLPPPPSAGPWLPPERTFAPLVAGAMFHAERVRNYEVGIEQQLGRTEAAPVIGVRRFRQSADHQIATLFGLDAESGVGHYYVAAPGAVVVNGWIAHVSGTLARHVHGAVDYSVGDAHWTKGWEAFAIAAVAPSAVRAARERIYDLTSTIETSIPDTATRASFAFRMNSAFSRATRAGAVPMLDGRFDFELHQALPFQPVRGSKIELMLAVRSLLRGLGEAGSMYDELLTVTPPRRVVGGVQVKF